MTQVKDEAHSLENAAARLHTLAERSRHRFHAPSWSLAALHELEEKAGHFHARVERYMADPRHTEADYQQLSIAFRNALRTRRVFRGDHRITRLFWRIGSTMRRLDRAYAGDRFDYRRAMSVAHQIDEQASRLHRRLERELGRHGHLSRGDRVAIRTVHELAEQAEHLHEVIERRNSSAAHSRRDAERVIALFDTVETRLRWTHLSRRLERDLYALRSATSQLRAAYGLGASGYRDHRRPRARVYRSGF